MSTIIIRGMIYYTIAALLMAAGLGIWAWLDRRGE